MKIYIYLLLTTLLISSEVKSQWEFYHEFPELSSNIYDIEIVNESTIFVSREYQIFKSIDFGKTWVLIMDTSDVAGAGFYDIEFQNENIGFCTKGGGTGACLATEDSGETWEAVIPVVGEYSPATNNLCIAAPGHVYLTAGEGYYEGKVLYTKNNFITLEQVRPASLNFEQQVADIDCINADTCISIHGTPYCCSDGWEMGIYRTTTGCETWELLGYFSDGLDVQFVSESTIYILGLFSISKSIDGGNTWEVIKEDAFIGSTFSSFKFLNDSVGYLAEWKYPENFIYFTEDGGETWIENTIDSMPAGKITAIDCWNVDSCFFGSSRKLYKNFSDPVSIMESGNSWNFTLTPNPATTILQLQLSLKENNYTIQTFNLVGELMPLNFQNNHADISHLSPGIYFTEVITEQGRAVQKWVKM
ncbi:MAG: T9SS type A sorting domain-containing protein [Chitinophagales bacterium]|nr:T9SS type A sorting domain-containing protein [Bacteroidota bacterium]